MPAVSAELINFSQQLTEGQILIFEVQTKTMRSMKTTGAKKAQAMQIPFPQLLLIPRERKEQFTCAVYCCLHTFSAVLAR